MLTNEVEKFLDKGLEYIHKIVMSMVDQYKEHHWIDADGKKIEVPILEDVGAEEWSKSIPHVEQFHYMTKANVVQVSPDGGKEYRSVMDMVIDNMALAMFYMKHGDLEFNTDEEYVKAVNFGRDVLNQTKGNRKFGWWVYKTVIQTLVLTIPRFERGDFKEDRK